MTKFTTKARRFLDSSMKKIEKAVAMTPLRQTRKKKPVKKSASGPIRRRAGSSIRQSSI